MEQRQTARIAEPISGDKLYQLRARAALPLLVRQAEAEQPIYYSDLADELGMPNPRNLNFVLGSIGRTLENLSKAWREEVPPIQCVVLSKTTQLPGEGIGWFLIKDTDFTELPRARKRELVNRALAQVYAYPRWRQVLQILALHPAMSDFTGFIEAASTYGRGGGESPDHRRLKEYVAANPTLVSLAPETPHALTEFGLPSGDSLDVSFLTDQEWVAIEVKARRSPEGDIVRELFQCVKYQAVMQAIESSEDRKPTGRAILLMEGVFPKRLLPLKNVLGVDVVDRATVPQSFASNRARRTRALQRS